MFENYDEILTVDQLMELLYIGKNTAYDLLRSGRIKAFRVGRVWKVPRRAVEEFVREEMTYTFLS